MEEATIIMKARDSMLFVLCAFKKRLLSELVKESKRSRCVHVDDGGWYFIVTQPYLIIGGGGD